MPADSGYMGRDRKDKVVPLRRHAVVAEIEERLSEARRLFSLHDYRGCDKVVREILSKDPQNHKAKALLDLTAIKLTHAKPAPRPGGSPAPEKSPDSAEGTDSQQQSLPASRGSEEEVDSGGSLLEHGRDLHEPAESAEAGEPNPMEFPPTTTSPEPLRQKDSLRERTISALVDLFQRKDLSLANWKDPRFQLDGQPVAERILEAEQKTRTKSEFPVEILPAEVQPPLPSEPPSGSGGSQESSSILETGKIPSEKMISASTGEPPPQPGYPQWVERKFEERSEDLRKSEIKTISIAQIKKYLYQEEYELCAGELENIRRVFPDNNEIQVFVENTFRRLTELQRIKDLEHQSRDLMSKATSLYQEGRLSEALDSASEALRLVPSHQQAREFVAFVHKKIEKEKKRSLGGKKTRYCWYCGVAVDSMSRFCFHCGQRLT